MAVYFAGALLLAGFWGAYGAADRVDKLYELAKSAEAAGDLAAASAKLEEIVKLEPRLAPAYNNLGVLYFKQGRYAQTVEILERGLKIDPRMVSAIALVGMARYQMGDYAKAKTSLEAAVAANPRDRNARWLLVNALTKLGEFGAAAKSLEEIVKREPRNQQAWYLLGRVYIQLSEHALGKINEIDANSVWAHEVSAELMESMKNTEGAIVEWKKAIAAAPRQPGVHFKLGDLYWSLSQWENAAEQFQLEREIDPANCRVSWKLGNIEIQRNGDLGAALALEEKALAACPNLTEARADRGKILLKLHREAEAIVELKALAEVSPDDAGPHFLLAQAYRATGKAQEAREEMRLFSELEAKAREATAARAEEVIKNSQTAH